MMTKSARLLQLSFLTMIAPSMLAMEVRASTEFASTSSLQKSRSLSQQTVDPTTCLLAPNREQQGGTVNVEVEFVLASNESLETMEDYVLTEIRKNIFDCLNQHESDTIQQDPRVDQHNNQPLGEWNRIADDLGISSLTVLPVSSEPCPDILHPATRRDDLSCGRVTISIHMESSANEETARDFIQHALSTHSFESTSIDLYTTTKPLITRQLRMMSSKRDSSKSMKMGENMKPKKGRGNAESSKGKASTGKRPGYWAYWKDHPSNFGKGKSSSKSKGTTNSWGHSSGHPHGGGGLMDWRDYGKGSSSKTPTKGQSTPSPSFQAPSRAGSSMAPTSSPDGFELDSNSPPTVPPSDAQDFKPDSKSPSTVSPTHGFYENGQVSGAPVFAPQKRSAAPTPTTSDPTVEPTKVPSSSPTSETTPEPTALPSSVPTWSKSKDSPNEPTPVTTGGPTAVPSPNPTVRPSGTPTTESTFLPTNVLPTMAPSRASNIDENSHATPKPTSSVLATVQPTTPSSSTGAPIAPNETSRPPGSNIPTVGSSTETTASPSRNNGGTLSPVSGEEGATPDSTTEAPESATTTAAPAAPSDSSPLGGTVLPTSEHNGSTYTPLPTTSTSTTRVPSTVDESTSVSASPIAPSGPISSSGETAVPTTSSSTGNGSPSTGLPTSSGITSAPSSVHGSGSGSSPPTVESGSSGSTMMPVTGNDPSGTGHPSFAPVTTSVPSTSAVGPNSGSPTFASSSTGQTLAPATGVIGSGPSSTPSPTADSSTTFAPTSADTPSSRLPTVESNSSRETEMPSTAAPSDDEHSSAGTTSPTIVATFNESSGSSSGSGPLSPTPSSHGETSTPTGKTGNTGPTSPTGSIDTTSGPTGDNESSSGAPTVAFSPSGGTAMPATGGKGNYGPTLTASPAGSMTMTTAPTSSDEPGTGFGSGSPSAAFGSPGRTLQPTTTTSPIGSTTATSKPASASSAVPTFGAGTSGRTSVPTAVSTGNSGPASTPFPGGSYVTADPETVHPTVALSTNVPGSSSILTSAPSSTIGQGSGSVGPTVAKSAPGPTMSPTLSTPENGPTSSSDAPAVPPNSVLTADPTPTTSPESSDNTFVPSNVDGSTLNSWVPTLAPILASEGTAGPTTSASSMGSGHTASPGTSSSSAAPTVLNGSGADSGAPIGESGSSTGETASPSTSSVSGTTMSPGSQSATSEPSSADKTEGTIAPTSTGTPHVPQPSASPESVSETPAPSTADKSSSVTDAPTLESGSTSGGTPVPTAADSDSSSGFTTFTVNPLVTSPPSSAGESSSASSVPTASFGSPGHGRDDGDSSSGPVATKAPSSVGGSGPTFGVPTASPVSSSEPTLAPGSYSGGTAEPTSADIDDSSRPTPPPGSTSKTFTPTPADGYSPSSKVPSYESGSTSGGTAIPTLTMTTNYEMGSTTSPSTTSVPTSGLGSGSGSTPDAPTSPSAPTHGGTRIPTNYEMGSTTSPSTTSIPTSGLGSGSGSTPDAPTSPSAPMHGGTQIPTTKALAPVESGSDDSAPSLAPAVSQGGTLAPSSPAQSTSPGGSNLAPSLNDGTTHTPSVDEISDTHTAYPVSNTTPAPSISHAPSLTAHPSGYSYGGTTGPSLFPGSESLPMPSWPVGDGSTSAPTPFVSGATAQPVPSGHPGASTSLAPTLLSSGSTSSPSPAFSSPDSPTAIYKTLAPASSASATVLPTAADAMDPVVSDSTLSPSARTRIPTLSPRPSVIDQNGLPVVSTAPTLLLTNVPLSPTAPTVSQLPTMSTQPSSEGGKTSNPSSFDSNPVSSGPTILGPTMSPSISKSPSFFGQDSPAPTLLNGSVGFPSTFSPAGSSGGGDIGDIHTLVPTIDPRTIDGTFSPSQTRYPSAEMGTPTAFPTMTEPTTDAPTTETNVPTTQDSNGAYMPTGSSSGTGQGTTEPPTALINGRASLSPSLRGNETLPPNANTTFDQDGTDSSAFPSMAPSGAPSIEWRDRDPNLPGAIEDNEPGTNDDDESTMFIALGVGIAAALLVLIAGFFVGRRQIETIRRVRLSDMGMFSGTGSECTGPLDTRRIAGTGDPPGSFHEGLYHYMSDGTRYLSTNCADCLETRRNSFYTDHNLGTIPEDQEYEDVIFGQSYYDEYEEEDDDRSPLGNGMYLDHLVRGRAVAAPNVHVCNSALCDYCRGRDKPSTTFLESPSLWMSRLLAGTEPMDSLLTFGHDDVTSSRTGQQEV